MSLPRWVGGLSAAALLAVSAVAVATAPDNAAVTAPFPISGPMGEAVTARALVVTVHSVELTEKLDVDYRDIPAIGTDGVWVVVDTTIESRLGLLGLSYAELWIDDVHYRVSDALPAPTPLLVTWGSGVPQRGSLVFELPRDALDAGGASRASIVFLHRLDASLDSVPVVAVDLTTLDVSPSVTLAEPKPVDNE